MIKLSTFGWPAIENTYREKMSEALRIHDVALLDTWILEELPIPCNGFGGPESERRV